jgi:hypothetical protein
MHFAVRSPSQYLVAHDPENVEIIRNSGERAMIRSLTTNVAHYGTFVHDVLDRVRRGQPPLARIADMVLIMRPIDDADAKAGPLPMRAASK